MDQLPEPGGSRVLDAMPEKRGERFGNEQTDRGGEQLVGNHRRRRDEHAQPEIPVVEGEHRVSSSVNRSGRMRSSGGGACMTGTHIAPRWPVPSDPS